MARAYFRLFYDQYIPLVEALNDQERGRLFLGMMRYAREEWEPDLWGNERFVWPFIKEDIDRDKIAYLRKCAANAANGRKGGLKKQENLANATHASPAAAELTQAKEAEEAKQAEEANQAKESEYAQQGNQTEAKQAVPGRRRSEPQAGEGADFETHLSQFLRAQIRPEDLDFDRICAEARRDELEMQRKYGLRHGNF